jgi:hypothetical protein
LVPLFEHADPFGPEHPPVELELDAVDEDDALPPPIPPMPPPALDEVDDALLLVEPEDEEADEELEVVEVEDVDELVLDAVVVCDEPPVPECELPHPDAPASGTMPSAVKVRRDEWLKRMRPPVG